MDGISLTIKDQQISPSQTHFSVRKMPTAMCVRIFQEIDTFCLTYNKENIENEADKNQNPYPQDQFINLNEINEEKSSQTNQQELKDNFEHSKHSKLQSDGEKYRSTIVSSEEHEFHHITENCCDPDQLINKEYLPKSQFISNNEKESNILQKVIYVYDINKKQSKNVLLKQNDTLGHSMLFEEFVESIHSEIPLPLDFQITMLASDYVYIRKKQFIDNPYHNFELDQNKIQSQNPFEYEEFQVIKVNNFGMKQHRILGVDGEKLYNYEPKAHKISNQTKKHQYGTKIPERLICTIKKVVVTKKGVDIVLLQKTLQLLIDDPQNKLKLERKINRILQLKK